MWLYAAAWVVVAARAVSRRWSLMMSQGTSPGETNVWDQITAVVGDPYVMSYLLVPVFLFHATTMAGHRGEIEVIQRHGSYARWVVGSVIPLGKAALMITLPVVVVALCSSLGLPWEWQWSASVGEPGSGWEILTGSGWAPLLLTILLLFGVTVSLTALGLVIFMASAVLSRPLRFIPAAAIAVWVILTFQIPTPMGWLNIADGFVITQAMMDFAMTPWAMLIQPGLWIVLLGFSAVLLDAWHKQAVLVKSLTGPLMAVISAVTIAMAVATSPWGMTTDVLFGLFYGADESGIHELTSFLFFMIVFLGPVYVALVGWEERIDDGQLAQELIRRGSIARWGGRLLLRQMWRYPLYLVGVLVWAILLSLVKADGVVGTIPPAGLEGFVDPAHLADTTWISLMIQFLVTGTLQGWVYLLIVLLIRWASGRPIGGIAALALLVCSGFFFAGRGAPVIMNSWGLASTISSITAVLATLGCWALGLIAASLVVTMAKPRHLILERNLAE
ncbi:MAG: hypothetical protein LBM23_04540 [Propionibacteriaceae bacterium]|jgi:hypothetical protein|nr:hypothetical protein [Propionibacteriaceae bacterium]